MPIIGGFAYSTPPAGGQGWYVRLPSAPAPAPAPPPAVLPPPALPAPTLAGQAWGWPIPLTAGRRAVPGRPIRRRLTKGADGHYVLDALVSFGWRAEVMAGFAPATF